MKHMRKLLALVIAVVMCMAMTVPTMADDPKFTVTITKDTTDKAAHTYGAYQIFAGKLESKDGKDILSDITVGDNITLATLITELNKIDGFALDDGATAATIAKTISDKNYLADSEEAQKLADAINAALNDSDPVKTGTIAAGETQGQITDLEAGYYLIKDTTAVSGEGAQTRYILEVVKNVPVTEKANVPEVKKKVKEKNDSVATSTTNPTDWQDAADYDIGDVIPYQITGTLPGRFLEFDTYKVYKFTDTLSAGLTITPEQAEAVTVKLNGTEDIKNLFDVEVNGQVLTVTLKSGVDLRTVEVNGAHLKATDKIVVEYNATLNSNAVLGSLGNPNEVYLDFTNNPNTEKDGEKGTTPVDKAIVFTYELIANKVDEDETTALKGAGFTLYKFNAATQAYEQVGDEVKGDDVTSFTFKGTDAGQYKLVETTVPPTYNKAPDLEFKVVGTYAATANKGETPELTELKVTDLNDNTLLTWTINSESYTIDQDTVVSENAKAETNIVNKKGSVLPSTGGIGTTIFYTIGAVLVLGAGIVLVTRRRMSAN